MLHQRVAVWKVRDLIQGKKPAHLSIYLLEGLNGVNTSRESRLSAMNHYPYSETVREVEVVIRLCR